MEVVLLISCTLTILSTANVYGAAIETSPDIIVLDHFSPADQEYLSYLEQEIIRKKRSEDILSLLKHKLAQSVKSKIGHIASASSHASHGKKDHHKEEYYHHHYGPPPEHHEEEEEKTFDFWDLQKSIFHTLLQAVKAIKGGLIAIKGHLIKGGGYIISAKGKLISAKGEAITKMGKHIAASAMLSRPHHKHPPEEPPEHEYIHHAPSSIGYTAPGGHDYVLHSPPHHDSSQHHESPPHHDLPPLSSYSDHKFPPSLEAYKDHLPGGAHHGILILKKIPKGHKDKHKGNDDSHYSLDSHHHLTDHHLSDSKPEEPSVPPFSFLPDIKDIFSASSVKGHEDKHSAHSSSAHSHSEYLDDEHSHHHYEPHHDHSEDSQDKYPHLYTPSDDDHEHKYPLHYSPSDDHAPSHTHYKLQSNHQFGSSNHHMKHSNPQATSYGTPIPVPDLDNSNYVKGLLNSFQNTQSTGGLSDYKTKVETYEPLQLHSNSGSGLGSHGLANFPTYPIDLSQSSGAQHKLLGYVPNGYYGTGPYY